MHVYCFVWISMLLHAIILAQPRHKAIWIAVGFSWVARSKNRQSLHKA